MHAVVEARRAAPAILYLPHLTLWWDTAPASLRATLWMLLADLPADLPLLLFATADAQLSELPQDALTLFGRIGSANVHELEHPNADERGAMFNSLAAQAAGPAEERKESAEAQAPPLVRAFVRTSSRQGAHWRAAFFLPLRQLVSGVCAAAACRNRRRGGGQAAPGG